MSSVRELLETAAPPTPRPTASSAELRRLGDRRRRRSQVVGAAVAVAAVAAAGLVGVRVLEPAAPPPDRAVAATPTPTPTSTPTPAVAQLPVRALEGTRWIPDLVTMGAAATQAYPDEPGARPRALLTFERGGVLVLDVMLPGRPTTTVRGRWAATSAAPALDPLLEADVHLDLVAPPGAPTAVVSLVSRLTTIATAEGYLPPDAPPSMSPLALFLYGRMHTGVLGLIDQVRPGAVLPSPYPTRP